MKFVGVTCFHLKLLRSAFFCSLFLLSVCMACLFLFELRVAESASLEQDRDQVLHDLCLF